MAARDLLSNLDLRRIVTDGDMDGLMAAAVLRHGWPEAEVVFSHPAEIRSGYLDSVIDEHTAICDLPFHPACGLYIDHHATNKPTAEEKAIFEERGGHVHWMEADSAARVAFELFRSVFDLSSLAPLMDMVDRLDSGRISHEEFLSDHPIIWLSRTVSTSHPEYTHRLLEKLVAGEDLESIMADPSVVARIAERRREVEEVRALLEEGAEVIDRLAVARIDETGFRTNGFLVTAHFGEHCDACMIIHGNVDGKLGEPDSWPLSASFYTNSFLHADGGIFDLTGLATLLDSSGGGHRNACGCRLVAMDDDGNLVERAVENADVQRNIDAWLAVWAKRSDN
jgi:oligoribonuclease NrnB/cAMP/cGMP phosphodiesterase (DHH superfamily)